MKQLFWHIRRGIFCILFLLFSPLSLVSQTIEDLSFGTDDTFEIVTWNIENFPKRGQTTINYVSRVIKALDIDVLAIQEVQDVDAFNTLVADLPGYEGYWEPNSYASLSFIYKKDILEVNDTYEIYTGSAYSLSFPRTPMVLDITYRGERIFIINNHYKCCGDGILEPTNPYDEEARRYDASLLLKQYIDQNLTNENVIVVGDFNDILTDNETHNVFQLFLDDEANYQFADYPLAIQGADYWSYPTWSSHLDHILITNELFDEYEKTSTVVSTIKIEDFMSGGWDTYDYNISDHRPVALKMEVGTALNINEHSISDTNFSNYPNPFNDKTTFLFKNVTGDKRIEIYNVLGQKIVTKTLSTSQNSFEWNTSELSKGIYIARLKTNQGIIKTIKLIKG